MDRSQKCAFRQSVNILPVPLLGALLGAPHGSSFLDAPSPKGSPEGEESEGGAAEPQASSVLTGAAHEQRNIRNIDSIFQCSSFIISEIK